MTRCPEAAPGKRSGAVRLPTAISLAALVALAGGAGLGLASQTAAGSFLSPATSWVGAVGGIWMDLLRATVLPMVFTFVVAALASTEGGRRAGRLAGAALLSFTLLLALATLYAVGLGSWMAARFAPAGEALARAAGGVGPAAAPAPGASGTPLEWLRTLVPTSLVDAASGEHVVALVAASAVLGFAVARLPPDRKAPIAGFFRGLADAVMTVVVWVLMAMPVGVFGLAWEAGATLGLELIRILGVWVLGTSFLVGSFTLALHPLGSMLGRVPLRELVTALAPAQLVAAGGRSSLGSLPALMEGAIHRLGVAESRAGFVLPLSAAAFKLGGTMNAIFALFLLARAHGVDLGPGAVAGFIAGALLLSYATPGIPSGGFTLRLPLFAAVGIPLESLVLLHAVDHLPDVFKTVCNTTTAMVVLVLSARLLGAPGPVGLGAPPPPEVAAA